MRRFHSYGPVDKELHYYAPREALVEQATRFLVGDSQNKRGHYFTVWGPRQTGKTWLMNEVMDRLIAEGRYRMIYLNLEVFKSLEDSSQVLERFVFHLGKQIPLGSLPAPKGWDSLVSIFSYDYLDKPTLLVLDEFDALDPKIIDPLVSVFRAMYVQREQNCLHGLALIGVRSVIGVESQRGSPFNIQRSLHIPNLNFDEVQGMFGDYQKESSQAVAPEVLERLFSETQGQPGLVSWFGELLTDTYKDPQKKTITLEQWETVLETAIFVLPNNTIINLVAKARDPKYNSALFNLFNTAERRRFSFDDEVTNYLYLNGIIDVDTQKSPQKKISFYIRFACPFIQKRLFNAFSLDLFGNTRVYLDPSDDLSDAITAEALFIDHLIDRYEGYIKKHAASIFKFSPRREDGRLFEAVYHFHLYYFLKTVGERWGIEVLPEFPTGNGKVDLLLLYQSQCYAIELKSFRDRIQYTDSLHQAARYAHQLGLKEITLCVFIEGGDEKLHQLLEEHFIESKTGVTVVPVVVGI